jgi:hypothetical protein
MDTGLVFVIGVFVSAAVCLGLVWLGDKCKDENKETVETQSNEFV